MKKNKCYDVLGIGAPLSDKIIHVSDDFLATLPGKKGGMEVVDYKTLTKILRDSKATPSTRPGGCSTNVIRALAHLGHKTALIGSVGSDAAGKELVNHLKAIDITTLYSTTDKKTGQALCIVTPDGERTFCTFLGASADIDENFLSPQSFENVRLVHIEGYTLLQKNLTLQAMRYSKEAKALISFDLASIEIACNFKDIILKLLAGCVDIVFSNAQETKALTGLSPEEGCSFLKNLCPLAIVSMGKDGCWVGKNNEIIYYPAYPVTPLDTTGAGDLFAAGFLHGILTHSTLEQSAHYGALLGRAIVQIEGAEIPMASWPELKRAFHQSKPSSF